MSEKMTMMILLMGTMTGMMVLGLALSRMKTNEMLKAINKDVMDIKKNNDKLIKQLENNLEI